jgi:hypothetical protein
LNEALWRISSHVILIIHAWLHRKLCVLRHRYLDRPLEWLSRRTADGAWSDWHSTSMHVSIQELPLELLWNIHLLVILLGCHELRMPLIWILMIILLWHIHLLRWHSKILVRGNVYSTLYSLRWWRHHCHVSMPSKMMILVVHISKV